MLNDLEEFWTQNSMTGGIDRASTVRALVRGESAVAFETALQDARVTAEVEAVPICTEHVLESLKAVTETVFPHRFLETQRLWMNRKMFKLVELTTRQMAASVNRLNNALPFFPNARETSRFSEVELIRFLEWSLPITWRAKFDLDGYIRTLHSKTKLIEACEAIEQSEIASENPSKEESSRNNKMLKWLLLELVHAQPKSRKV
jgi:predicted unusual protein kinase regulating ubiquinone biosynthesis (AarF/ABC1/UbiB family)